MQIAEEDSDDEMEASAPPMSVHEAFGRARATAGSPRAGKGASRPRRMSQIVRAHIEQIRDMGDGVESSEPTALSSAMRQQSIAASMKNVLVDDDGVEDSGDAAGGESTTDDIDGGLLSPMAAQQSAQEAASGQALGASVASIDDDILRQL